MAILSDLVIVQPKSKIKAGEGLSEGKYKFFTSSNIQTKWLNEFQYDKPALIFGTGGMASVHYCDTPFSTSTDCIVLYAKDNANLEYIYRYLESHMGILEDGFKGVGLKHISKDYILNIQIPENELSEQKNIVDLCNKIDLIILSSKKQLEKFDELVKARFVEMFGDPKTNNKKWKMNTFSNMCTVRQGLQIPISKRLTHCEDNCYEYITVAYLHGSKEREYIKNPKSTVVCTKEDILMTRTGNTGMVVTDVAGVFHNNFFLIDFDRERYNKKFLVVYLNLELVQAEIIRRAGTSTIPDLNHGEFYAITVYEPPMNLQKQFADFVEQIDKSKVEIQQSLLKLEILKKSLMQQYFE